MKKVIILIVIILVVVLASIGIIYSIVNKEDIVENKLETDENFYMEGGAIYEKIGEISSSSIESNIKKINNVYDDKLKNMNVYFTIIPDKTYYLESSVDTEFVEMEKNVVDRLNENIKYFNISDSLSLNDFYKTDMHWKQENLDSVVEKILEEMNIEHETEESNKVEEKNTMEKKEEKSTVNEIISMYIEKSAGDFYGTYYSKVDNSNIQPDELKYLTNDILDNCKVYNVEIEEEEPIYNLKKAEETKNKYDLFLSGASSIEIIKNNNSKTDKKLILFRDSFGSSLAPLLVNEYREIVLIDLRYVNYSILENYIDFSDYENQDVLFIYSSRVLNKSGIFK